MINSTLTTVFSSSSDKKEEQRKIHTEKIQIISSQLPRLIRVDT